MFYWEVLNCGITVTASFFATQRQSTNQTEAHCHFFSAACYYTEELAFVHFLVAASSGTVEKDGHHFSKSEASRIFALEGQQTVAIGVRTCCCGCGGLRRVGTRWAPAQLLRG